MFCCFLFVQSRGKCCLFFPTRFFQFAVQNANSKDLELTQNSSGITDRSPPVLNQTLKSQRRQFCSTKGFTTNPKGMDLSCLSREKLQASENYFAKIGSISPCFERQLENWKFNQKFMQKNRQHFPQGWNQGKYAATLPVLVNLQICGPKHGEMLSISPKTLR